MIGTAISAVRIVYHHVNRAKPYDHVEPDTDMAEDVFPVAESRVRRSRPGGRGHRYDPSRAADETGRTGASDTRERHHVDVALDSGHARASYTSDPRVESLEKRVDMLERKMQQIAGQLATETHRASPDNHPVLARVKVEESATLPDGEYFAETRQERRSMDSITDSRSSILRTREQLARAKCDRKSPKKISKRRRFDDLEINGTPKLDLHHVGRASRSRLMRSHASKRWERLREDGERS